MANRSVDSAGDRSSKPVRASISFARSDYCKLERIARDRRVSVAWVVRDAIEMYFRNQSTRE